jgi:hypothetical protein
MTMTKVSKKEKTIFLFTFGFERVQKFHFSQEAITSAQVLARTWILKRPPIRSNAVQPEDVLKVHVMRQYSLDVLSQAHSDQRKQSYNKCSVYHVYHVLDHTHQKLK